MGKPPEITSSVRGEPHATMWTGRGSSQKDLHGCCNKTSAPPRPGRDAQGACARKARRGASMGRVPCACSGSARKRMGAEGTRSGDFGSPEPGVWWVRQRLPPPARLPVPVIRRQQRAATARAMQTGFLSGAAKFCPCYLAGGISL